MDVYINALKGISHSEWTRLKAGIDRTFDKEKGELERQLKFADAEKAKQFIQSQFG